MAEKIGGIIMSGGKSSRMGTDKGLMVFKGKQLVEYPIELLHPFCSNIIISTNQSAYKKFGLTTVPDIYRNRGPVGGLHAALNKTDFDFNIVLACDVPFVESELFKFLLKESDGFDAIVPQHSGGFEPLVAVYRKKIASQFENNLLNGNYKLLQILRSSRVKFVNVDHLLLKYPRMFDNLNSPEDLAGNVE